MSIVKVSHTVVIKNLIWPQREGIYIYSLVGFYKLYDILCFIFYINVLTYIIIYSYIVTSALLFRNIFLIIIIIWILLICITLSLNKLFFSCVN